MTILLEEKLNTNYVPIPVEINLLERRVAESEETISLLTAEIARLRDRCNELSVDKQHLSIGIAEYNDILAPARRLIPEILQEIFYHCLPTTHNAVMSALEAPLLLGRVCNHWRQIAYSTPRLWTSIHIVTPSARPYDPAFPTDNTWILTAVSKWLARSGVLPLSISIISSTYSLDPFVPINGHIRPFLNLLSSFASRWRSVSFVIENYSWPEFFDRYGAEDVPLLEKFHFDGNLVPSMTAANPWDPVQADFAAATRENSIFYAPRLRSVSIPRFAPRILQFPIRWSELLELNLSLGIFSLQDVLRTLELCPELRVCSIFIPNVDPVGHAEAHTSPPKITLPKLETLALKDECWWKDMCTLLETLITPQLCHLSYCQTVDFSERMPSHEQQLMEALDLFLRNLIEPLQELELRANRSSFEAVLGVLEMVPGLKRLSVVSYGMQTPMPQSGHFDFADRVLQRFIPEVLSAQPQTVVSVSRMSHNVVDLPLDVDSNSCLLDGSEETSSSGSLTVSSHPEKKMVAGRLCPNLEVFDCAGAMFSESIFLEFLRARSIRHQELGVAHMKSVNVTYVPGRKPSESFRNEVLKLGKLTGMNVYLTYANSLSPLSSHGIISENAFYPTFHFGFS